MEDEKALMNAGSNVELVTLENIETRMAVAWENVARNYLEVGRLLCEAKDHKLVPHGKWEAWVAENAHMSERQAQKLMQMARAVPQGSALASLLVVSLLSLPWLAVLLYLFLKANPPGEELLLLDETGSPYRERFLSPAIITIFAIFIVFGLLPYIMA